MLAAHSSVAETQNLLINITNWRYNKRNSLHNHIITISVQNDCHFLEYIIQPIHTLSSTYGSWLVKFSTVLKLYAMSNVAQIETIWLFQLFLHRFLVSWLVPQPLCLERCHFLESDCILFWTHWPLANHCEKWWKTKNVTIR